MIEKGTYLARCVDIQLGKSPKKGTDQVEALFEVKDGQFKGDRITWRGYFSEATIERTLESLEYCGWDGRTMSDLSSAMTKDVEIVIDHEPGYEDSTKIFARVQWVNKAGGRSLSVKQAMTSAETADFDSRMKAALIERRQRKANEGPAPEFASRGGSLRKQLDNLDEKEPPF